MIKNLEICEIGELLQHEQTMDKNIMRLKEAMLNIGQQVDPLIIDRKSRAVLDGNHRLKVLEIIKVPRTVCQLVDYGGEQITIGGWLPVTERLTIDDVKNAGLKTEEVDFEAGKRALDGTRAAFMLRNQEKDECCLISPEDYDLHGMIEAQKNVLDKLNNKEKFMYIADDSIELQLAEGRTVLFRRNFLKKEVVAEAIAKRPLPPKSTRHMIPDRIIRLNMRLGWLHQTKEEATKYLENMLHDRVYNGNVRRYTEPVIVIY